MILIRTSEMHGIVDRHIQLNNLKKHWPNFSVNVSNGIVCVNGSYSKTYFKYKYEFSIYYKPGVGDVKCWILSPKINKNNFIHVNSDDSLCLYHHRDYSIDRCFYLGSEIIPWVYEWIHYFEEYLVNGNIWKGSEAAHG